MPCGLAGEELGREVPERADDLRADELDLREEVALARLDLARAAGRGSRAGGTSARWRCTRPGARARSSGAAARAPCRPGRRTARPACPRGSRAPRRRTSGRRPGGPCRPRPACARPRARTWHSPATRPPVARALPRVRVRRSRIAFWQAARTTLSRQWPQPQLPPQHPPPPPPTVAPTGRGVANDDRSFVTVSAAAGRAVDIAGARTPTRAPRTCPSSRRTGTRRWAWAQCTRRRRAKLGSDPVGDSCSRRRNLRRSRMPSHTVVIGAGRVGSVVAARLGARGVRPRRGGADLDGVPARLRSRRPTRAIADVCRALAPRARPPRPPSSTSRARTSVHALDAAPGPKACVHPVQTIWPERGPDQLEGAYAAVTGDWALGSRPRTRAGPEPFPLADEMKPLYHAASVFASNYLVTITRPPVDLLERRPASSATWRCARCGPLQHRTVDVAGRRARPGPIARGDAATVAAHLEAIGPELRAALPRARPGHPAARRSRVGRRRPRAAVTTGLVPTMGALHDGHRALLRAARAGMRPRRHEPVREPDPVRPRRGLSTATRATRQRDRAIAAEEGVDEVFAPTVEEMYPDGFSTSVSVGDAGRRFEGAYRPGHFDGVATVVAEAVDRLRPDVAYFGAEGRPAAGRDPADDRRPGRGGRRSAPSPPSARAGRPRACRPATSTSTPSERRRRRRLHRALRRPRPGRWSRASVDYLAVVDPDTFLEVGPRPGALLIGAARFGVTRLIDNIILEAR